MSAIELYPGVIADSSILGGKPVVKGTRVPVSLVLGQLAGGMSVEEVMYEYYLDIEGIRAALRYDRLKKEMLSAGHERDIDDRS